MIFIGLFLWTAVFRDYFEKVAIGRIGFMGIEERTKKGGKKEDRELKDTQRIELLWYMKDRRVIESFVDYKGKIK